MVATLFDVSIGTVSVAACVLVSRYILDTFMGSVVRHRVVDWVFTATFLFSFLLLELVVFEILKILDQDIRHTFWRFVLCASLVMVILVLSTARRDHRRRRQPSGCPAAAQCRKIGSVRRLGETICSR